MTMPPTTGSQVINLREIVPSRWQARTTFDPAGLLELATSIRDHGLINPLIVFADEEAEQVELLAGERRSRAIYAIQLVNHKLAKNLDEAAKLAAAHSLPELAAMFPHAGVTIPTPARFVAGPPEQLQEVALVDNLQRADLTALDEAHAIKLMLDSGYSQRKLAERLGKSQTYISQRLILLDLAPALVEQFTAGALDATTARELARLDPAVQPQALNFVRQEKFSSRQAQTLAGRILELSEPAAWPRTGANARFNHLVAHTLEGLDQPDRQRAIIALASANSDSQPRLPKEDWHYRRLFHALGLARDEYVATNTTWLVNAPELGVSCQNCQFRPFMARVQALGSRSDAAWPKCGPNVNVCPAHLPEGGPVHFVVPYDTRLEYPAELSAHITDPDNKYGWERTVDDIEAGLQITALVYAEARDRAAAEQAAKEFGLAKAIAELARDQISLTPKQLFSQPCAACVFHQAGATDPDAWCQHQALKPTFEGYGNENAFASLWRADSGAIIARCSMFRFRDIRGELPDAMVGISAHPDYLMSLLHKLRKSANYGGAVYLPAWLNNVPRSGKGADAAPAWGAAEKHLRQLLELLTSGQRLALLALWNATFNEHYQSSDEPEITVDPFTGQPTAWRKVVRYGANGVVRTLKTLVQVFAEQEEQSA